MSVTKIGEIIYKDIIVSIYNDSEYSFPSHIQVAWQMRNPNSCYEGMIYMSYSGKMAYPEGAVIPEQTTEDKEMLPSAVVTGAKVVDDDFIELLTKYLDIGYTKRNKKENIREITINKILK
jgi:hypothetical protein